ncbi:uncharacterized protein [Porites lutea]|uniref:uncharacterized protein n=1 Tax=Porites lutea TaxID=51062 RepID=UPI003CC5934E
MSSPTSPRHSPVKNLVELTPVLRGGASELQKTAKVYDSELCMLALPPDEQQLLSRISQYLFCQGIITVVVRNPTEALIHSRHSHFVVIILPDNDPLLIRNIRSVDGMNSRTPVIVISTADILPESTLHMLGTNEVQEAVHMTTNSEKLEADLIYALNNVLGRTYGNVRSVPLLPLPVQTTWSTIPQPTSAHIPSVPFPQLPEPGLISPQCATNPVHTKIPPTLSPAKIQGVNAVSAGGGSHLNDQISSYSSQQLQVGTVGEQVTEILNQGSSVSVKVSPPLCENVQENSESVLPGIETLLNAIQVVEGQEDDSSAKNQAACTFTKFTALNSPDSDETRGLRTKKRTRRSPAAGSLKSAKTATSETDLDSPSDTKSPISVSLTGKKPYFLELDSYREPLADDPNANPVDRHNSKERHRRIRITKAAEFFKAVIPRMDPNMDKATAFQWTVYYMVFLRNALLKQDPPILPKLHQTFIQEWGEVFNLESQNQPDEK